MAKAFSVLLQQQVTVTIEGNAIPENLREVLAATEGVDELTDEALAQLVVQDIATGGARFNLEALLIDVKIGAAQVELVGA